MLTFFGPERKCRGDVSRRDVLRVGGLAFAGLTLADVLRLRASARRAAGRGKSVIMIWLRGGASHIDSYDMKPDAPAEIRGEFKPIRTNVPGIQICEHLPRHAQDHGQAGRSSAASSRTTSATTRRTTSSPASRTAASGRSFGVGRQPPAAADGRPAAVRQPDVRAAGAVRQRRPDLHRPGPPAVRAQGRGAGEPEPGEGRLARPAAATAGSCSREFDTLSREVDRSGAHGGHRRVHAAGAGDDRVAEGARGVRPVEGAGRDARAVRQVLRELPDGPAAGRGGRLGGDAARSATGTRTRRTSATCEDQLPQLDQGFHALVTDLHDRGLEKDVAVVMWGEFGRAPRISRGDGRDHWPEAGRGGRRRAAASRSAR